LNKRGTIVNTAYVAVQKLWTTATDSSAASTVRLAAATKLLLGGLLIGGLVLLVLKLKEWADAAGQISIKQRTLNEVGRAAADSYGKEKSQLDLLISSIKTEGISRNEKFAILKKLQADYPGYFDNIKTEKDLNDKLADAYKRASEGILQKANAEAAANLLSQNASKKLTAQIDLQERIQKINQYEREGLDKEFAARGTKGVEQFRAANQKARVFAAQEFNNLIKDIGAQNEVLINSIQDANKEIEKLGGKTTKTETPAATKAKAVDNSQIEKDLKARFDLFKLEKERELELLNGIFEDDKENNINRFLAAINYIETKQRLISDEAEFEKKIGKKSADEIALIDKKASLDRIRVAEEYEKKVHDLKRASTEGVDNTNRFQTASYSSLYNEIIKKLDEYDKKQKEIADNEKHYHEERKKRLEDLGNELKNLAFDLISASIDKEKNAVQDSIDALETKKQKEIEVANQTILNEQDKAAKIAVINARAQAQKDALERRQRQLDEQKARFEKAKAVVDIIQGTTVAIVKTLAEYPGPHGIVLAAIIGAIGAAQLVKTLAQPIPHYAEGTDDHPGGLAVVGDAKKKEYVETPDGKVYETPSTDTLVDIPKGSKVYKDRTTMDRMMNYHLTASLSTKERPNDYYQFQNMTKEITGELKQVKKAITNIPQPVFDRNGLKQVIHGNGKVDEYIRGL
jgi:hypothetical protein